MEADDFSRVFHLKLTECSFIKQWLYSFISFFNGGKWEDRIWGYRIISASVGMTRLKRKRKRRKKKKIKIALGFLLFLFGNKKAKKKIINPIKKKINKIKI